MAIVTSYLKRNKPSQEIVIKKTMLSSDIVQSGAALTNGAIGELFIKNIIVKTDGTGLAAGTNLQIYCDNANGLANIFVTAVSGLGANKTLDITTASVTKQPTVLENGKKISINSTVADCTGSGIIDVYIIAVPLSDSATLS